MIWDDVKSRKEKSEQRAELRRARGDAGSRLEEEEGGPLKNIRRR
jgi:hypothetical protein